MTANGNFTTSRLIGPNNAEHTFYIDRRYDISNGKILGAGSFGVVCSGFDIVRQEKVAIKKVLAYCGDEWDARHALREIRLMRLLSPHPNVSLFMGPSIYISIPTLICSIIFV